MCRISQVTDEQLLVDWHRIDARTRGADHFALPADPIGEQVPRLAGEFNGERHELWLLTGPDGPVAAGDVAFPLHDNLHSAGVDLRVLPEARGRGHGRQLLEHLLGRVRQQGRSRAFFEICESQTEPGSSSADAPPDPAGPAVHLATAVGARPVQASLRRLLKLDGRSPLPGHAEHSADGYDLVQWVDRAREELLDQLAFLHARMSTDAPMGDMNWEPEAWDAARVREHEESAIRRGRRVLATAAREEASGQLVGYTDIGVNSKAPEVGYQWDTLVIREHRGHGLGLRMKAANLALLRATLPQVRYLNTWNAASNRHMIAINEALGFRPVERWWEWQLDF